MNHLNIDVWGTAEKLHDEGLSVYDMILAASLKARKLAQERNKLDIKDGKLNKYEMKPINQALSDISKEI